MATKRLEKSDDTRIYQALFLSHCECKDCPYNRGNFCPAFWRQVFIKYYEVEPIGDNDPKWTHLFKIGFPARQKIE